MIRNCFVREERDSLVLGNGILSDWLSAGNELSFGPTLTLWGEVSVHFAPGEKGPRVRLDASWNDRQPEIHVRVPDMQPFRLRRTGEWISLSPSRS